MEIERKWVVDRELFLTFIKDKVYKTKEISQYYIPALDGTFRLRRTRFEDNTYTFVVALKRFLSEGKNEEMEVNIDSNVAYEMVTGIKSLTSLRKVRYIYEDEDKHIWEVDLFSNGMTLAEVELPDLKEQVKQMPFLQDEVTGNKQFSNEYIASHLSGSNI